MDCGCRPGPISISTPWETRKCQLRNTSSMVATWKFMWHSPGWSPRNTASLWCTGSILQQAGRVADPVRHPGVEPGAPEPVGLVHVRRVQAQVTELGDPGRPAERDRPGDRLLLADQLQPVAERVVEGDELPDPAGPGLRRRAPRTVIPERSSSVSAAASASVSRTLKPDAMHARRPLDQRQAVVAVVGAQMGDAGLGRGGQFQADDAGGEPGGGVQVGHAGADVGDVGERDHRTRSAVFRARSGEDRGHVDVDLPVARPGRRRRPGCRRSARSPSCRPCAGTPRRSGR